MKNIDCLIEKKAKELILVRRKLFVIEWIEKFPGNVRQELKEFDIPKSTYYDWRRRYRLEGKEGLERKRPVVGGVRHFILVRRIRACSLLT